VQQLDYDTAVCGAALAFYHADKLAAYRIKRILTRNQTFYHDFLLKKNRGNQVKKKCSIGTKCPHSYYTKQRILIDNAKRGIYLPRSLT
jgi:hypothetical protein